MILSKVKRMFGIFTRFESISGQHCWAVKKAVEKVSNLAFIIMYKNVMWNLVWNRFQSILLFAWAHEKASYLQWVDNEFGNWHEKCSYIMEIWEAYAKKKIFKRVTFTFGFMGLLPCKWICIRGEVLHFCFFFFGILLLILVRKWFEFAMSLFFHIFHIMQSLWEQT